ncbi:hypothetical protein [Cellulomonas sp. S1-8]|nr:hypothetical protein [Cellulomonas sp. S1-8]UZN03157.1 hypothetical protein OKX07_19230 [Cellulomonas sp. S1-8]
MRRVDGLAIFARGLRATSSQMFEATVRAASAAWQAGHRSGPRPAGG